MDLTFQVPMQKTKIMASGPITSWERDGETVETVSDFILGVLVVKGLVGLHRTVQLQLLQCY